MSVVAGHKYAKGSDACLVEFGSKPAGLELTNPYRTQRTVSPTDLVSLAQSIQQYQARRIIEEAKRDSDLHHAACNMVKIPGKVYHLYQRGDSQKYFSVISPEEWGNSPHVFIQSYRLEHDMSWTPVDGISSRNAAVEEVTNLYLSTSDSVLALK